MKVVPEDVSTAPLEGAGRPLQSTAACEVDRKYMTWTNVISISLISTCTI